ncbi:MAG TPA: TRAP transporter substrate-binding protein DctP [Syntrophorhabdaceae bacterium]|nr:TRAP transporter substrate-binding protein DctP [Syntrophorhabdaceae bacterium]
MRNKKLVSTLTAILFIPVLISFCLLTQTSECRAQPSTYNWKMVLARPSGAVPNIPFIEFANEVQKRSNGRIKITVYEATLGAPADFWDMVKNNVVQLAVNGEGYSPGRMPLTTVIGLPFEVQGHQLCDKILARLLASGKLTELTDNFKVLFFVPTNPHMMFLKKKITKMEDFKGLKLAPVPGMGPLLVKALGGSPNIVPGAERYMALQTGIIDGIITMVDDVVDRKFYEVAKYAVNEPLYNGTYVLTMNLDAYNALPADLKAIMTDAAQKAHDNEMKRNAAYVAECWSKLTKNGMEVYRIEPTELARWRKAAANIPDEWIAANPKVPARDTLQFVRDIVKTSK